jgi:hypothetical protein
MAGTLGRPNYIRGLACHSSAVTLMRAADGDSGGQ